MKKLGTLSIVVSQTLMALAFSQEIKLALVGDILMHQPLQRQAKQQGSFSGIWAPVQNQLARADITYGNVEGPLADGLKIQTIQFSFNFPGFLARDLKSSGFDIVSTANNHALDRGTDGVFRTIRTMDEAGLNHVGSRSNGDTSEGFYKVLESKGIRTAWISCTQVRNSGFSNYVADCSEHREYLGKLIQTMKKEFKADVVIVTPHWGSEYQSRANETQKNLARYFFKKGADLIVGAHPHVLQQSETLEITDELGETKKRLVFYSLGNFVSNQSFMGVAQRSSVIANVSIRKTNGMAEVASYNVIPLIMRANPHRIMPLANEGSDEMANITKAFGEAVTKNQMQMR